MNVIRLDETFSTDPFFATVKIIHHGDMWVPKSFMALSHIPSSFMGSGGKGSSLNSTGTSSENMVLHPHLEETMPEKNKVRKSLTSTESC